MTLEEIGRRFSVVNDRLYSVLSELNAVIHLLRVLRKANFKCDCLGVMICVRPFG